MYSSVKFFVASVTGGLPWAGRVAVVREPPPPEPQPESSITKTASAIARNLIALILTGSLDGSHGGRPVGHRSERRAHRLSGLFDRQLHVDREHLEVLPVRAHAAELLEQPQHRLVRGKERRLEVLHAELARPGRQPLEQ